MVADTREFPCSVNKGLFKFDTELELLAVTICSDANNCLQQVLHRWFWKKQEFLYLMSF